MTSTLVPNEILVRYDANGKFQGAHVAYLKLIRDETGAVVHREAQTLVPISSPTDPAFTNVLSAVLTDALVQNNELRAQIAAHENDEPRPAPAPVAESSVWPWFYSVCAGAILETAYIILHLAGVL